MFHKRQINVIRIYSIVISRDLNQEDFNICQDVRAGHVDQWTVMSQSIPTGYIPPGQPPGLAQKLPGGSGLDF